MGGKKVHKQWSAPVIYLYETRDSHNYNFVQPGSRNKVQTHTLCLITLTLKSKAELGQHEMMMSLYYQHDRSVKCIFIEKKRRATAKKFPMFSN